MPILKPYTQQVASQGELNVQASPQDFGSAIGEGIQRVGQGEEALNDSVRAVEEQKGQVWAIKAASDAQLAQTQQLQAMQTDPEFAKKYGEDGGGFTDAFRAQYEDYANTQLDAAPTGQARRFLQAHLTEIGGSLSQDAMKLQAQAGANWATSSLTTALNQNGMVAYKNPEKFDQLLTGTYDSIDNMPHLTPEQRNALKIKSKEDLAFASGRGAALQDGAGTLGFLNPTLSQKLNPTARQSQAIDGNTVVQLPQNTAGDLVKPYDANKVNEVATLTKAPSQYDDLFNKAAQTYGISAQELKMRVAAESGMNPKAQGPVTKFGQSVGLAQFTEATAAQYGVTDRTDPQQSIFGMAKMLADLQGKAGGDESKVDKMYYGGESGANWGNNTSQYAENLAAVRSTLQGGDSVHTSFDQVLASVTQDKEPVKSDAPNTPSWFNNLNWEQQYTVMREAKQNALADITRQNQMAELAEKARTLKQKQTMTGWMDNMIDGKLTVDEIRNDPSVDWDGKEKALNALAAGMVGRGKTDPKVFRDTYNAIHAPDGDPNKITDEKQIFTLVGQGTISYEDGKKLNEEIQGRGSQEGEVIGDMKKAFMKQAYDKLVQTNMFKTTDPTQAANYYNFQQAFLTKYAAQTKGGKSPYDLLNPNSKDYMGDMIDQFNRTPQQQMQDMAAARRAQQPAALNPTTVKVIDPNGKTGIIPAGQLNDALKQGYKKAP